MTDLIGDMAKFDLATLTLLCGGHLDRKDGVCLMEAVAWMAGERHGDAPTCACPVLAAYGRRLNDGLLDEERQLLVYLVPQLVDTRSTRAVETARRKVLVAAAYRLADHAVRVSAPLALEARGKPALAAELRALAPIVDRETSLKARQVAWSVRDRAGDAAAAAAAADAAAAWAAAAAAAAARSRRLEARRPIVDIAIAAFREAISITEEAVR